LWDEALPIMVRELPADLAALDVLLSDPGLLRRLRRIGSAKRSSPGSRLPVMAGRRSRSRPTSG